MVEMTSSEIASFYANKSVFITGGTGFVGNVLIEKLLRSCPDVGTIYLLIREKRGMDGQQRLEQLLGSPCFDNVQSQLMRKRFHAIVGDTVLPNLGISEEDRRLLQENVAVVMHVAATIKFNEKLKTATQINLVGTSSILELCKGMKKLEAMVHVSTAYANCLETALIEEKVYPPPISPERLMEMAATLDENEMELLTPTLLGDYPNTYTFTKQVAESLVASYKDDIPIAIVRPSIIGASWKEPYAGWVNAIHGPAGIIVPALMGIYHTIKASGTHAGNMIPVDLCANAIIVAAWDAAKRSKSSSETLVFHSTNNATNLFNWSQWNELLTGPMGPGSIMGIPLHRITFIPNEYMHSVFSFFVEDMPAWVGDMYLKASGGKAWYRSMVGKLQSTKRTLTYFIAHEWDFGTKNIAALSDRLSPADKETFYMSVENIDWETYSKDYVAGAKKYLLKNKSQKDQSKNEEKESLVKSLLTPVKIGTVGFCIYLSSYCSKIVTSIGNLMH